MQASGTKTKALVLNDPTQLWLGLYLVDRDGLQPECAKSAICHLRLE